MPLSSFTVEGDASLAYFADQPSGMDRHVLVDNEGESVSIAQLVAMNLDFPDEDEFDQHFQRMEQLRSEGLQPVDGEPDIVRDNVKLRITVEVI